jgi:hypothetical protein
MSNIYKEAAFRRFMEKNGPNAAKSKNNYISWLCFVSDNFHKIDKSLNKSVVDEIYREIKNSQNDRDIYKRDKDASNIRSALNKYCKFIAQI